MNIGKLKKRATHFSDFLPGNRMLDHLADVFADIERLDKRVEQLVLSQNVLDILSEDETLPGVAAERNLWGTQIIVSNKIEPNRIYVSSEDEKEARWILLVD